MVSNAALIMTLPRFASKATQGSRWGTGSQGIGRLSRQP